MAERLQANPEHHHENIDTSEETRRNLERLERTEAEHEPSKDEIDSLQKNIEKAALGSGEVRVDAAEKEQPEQHGNYKELKQAAFKRTLQSVQAKLPKAERVFSKVVHRPAVDAVSNALATTVARPSGILGGGICALLGSSFLLYLSKEFGFAYNYFTFFVLVAIGYLLGLVVELTIRTLKARK